MTLSYDRARLTESFDTLHEVEHCKIETLCVQNRMIDLKVIYRCGFLYRLDKCSKNKQF